LTFDACFPDSVVGFIAYENEANSLYVHGLFWFFQSILEKNAPAAAQKNINLEILRGLVVPKPPISLQNQFAEVVGKIEALKSRYQQSLADLEALYGTLSQRAFRGELDLSRVPMLGESTEIKELESQEPILIGTAETAITLPDIDGLLDFVQGPVRQQDILKYWLDDYRDQLGETTFSAQRFMLAAQTFLTDLFPDNDIELSNNDYERIKTWLFAALEDGRLKQARDITEHDEKGTPVFGNHVEIKYGAQP
jgi:type I restriction enzyme S subunit